MINHKLFIKSENIHALLTSYSHPNILIPIRAIVKDVKYDEINPQYLLKAIDFYDNIRFLKHYLFEMSFSNQFDRRARNFKLKPDSVVTREDLINMLSGPKEKDYYFVVDSIMCTRYRGDLIDLFNKLQDHLLEVRFRECREMMSRNFYKGRYSVQSYGEFNKRFEKFLGDKIDAAGISRKKYFELL
ncbi:MAG: hypothetical protein ACFFKA_10330 [Candidatus Thorarchaeota archaeon]